MRRPGFRAMPLVALLLSTLALGQSSFDKLEVTRSSFAIPEPTNDGDWYGTWFHVSREHQIALWFRQGEQLPEVRVRYFRLGGSEQFVSDWTGVATYEVRGAPGRFALALTEGTADRLRATWDWSLEFTDSSRAESADVALFRSGDGRHLALHFERFERTFRRGSIVEHGGGPHVLTFEKASRRLVLWDELPF